MESLPSEGLPVTLPALRPSTDAATGKIHGPHVKEIGGVPVGQVLTGTHRDFHQEWKHWREPFSFSFFSLVGPMLVATSCDLFHPHCQHRSPSSRLPLPTCHTQPIHPSKGPASAAAPTPTTNTRPANSLSWDQLPSRLSPALGKKRPAHLLHAHNSCGQVLQPVTAGANLEDNPTPKKHACSSWSKTSWPAVLVASPTHQCTCSGHGLATTGEGMLLLQWIALEHLVLGAEEDCTSGTHRMPST